jgi:hypothetical protein
LEYKANKASAKVCPMKIIRINKLSKWKIILILNQRENLQIHQLRKTKEKTKKHKNK